MSGTKGSGTVEGDLDVGCLHREEDNGILGQVLGEVGLCGDRGKKGLVPGQNAYSVLALDCLGVGSPGCHHNGVSGTGEIRGHGGTNRAGPEYGIGTHGIAF